MNANTMTTTTAMEGSRWRASRADLPVLALGGLLAATITTGNTAITAAGVGLAGLSLLITAVVLAFSRRQLRADPRSGSFARLATGLAIATVLMGLSANALLLAAAWIVSGRLMAGLIGHVGEWHEAREASRRANIAFAIGDLALVGAVALLALAAGSTDIAAIKAAAASVPTTATTVAAPLLVIATLARCAIPPFSTWLMRSLAAPTPVSALMHAGFVNAGGFLLIQFAPVLEASIVARHALFATGIVAALVGSAIMLVRADIKGSLAASTVGQMGFMLLTVALGAYPAALWHMVAHGLFKAWLFLGSAGTISTGPARAKGLARPWPAVIALTTVAGAIALIETSQADALLPIGLALTALLSAMAIAMRALPRGLLGAMIALAPIMLIALNAGVLALMTALQPSAAQPLLSPYGQLAILSLFLAGWVWQQRIVSGEQALSPALFARLSHAGNIAHKSPKYSAKA
ncbi:MAG: proton-conducting transporter membrane subunit [Novosphingobium sp.]